MAFPFTWLAIILAMFTQTSGTQILSWLGFEFFYKILLGFGIGLLSGKLIGLLLFSVSDKYKFFQTRESFVAISLTFAVYGLTELALGYGFIAVFVCALSLRSAERKNKYHEKLHEFTEQIEKLLIAIVLIFFGGSLVTGILKSLTWQLALFSFVFIFLIRPITAYFSLAGYKYKKYEKLVISFFGIRGMGSVFYLSFAFSKIRFEYENELWSMVAFTILISILIHGLTASRTMELLEKSHKN
jgi:NhaP-type Na+/H+ or K+/H+ antiporter